MQPRRDHPGVLAPVLVQALEGDPGVGDERPPAHLERAVAVRHGVLGDRLRLHVHVGDGRVGSRSGSVGEHPADRGRQAPGEEGRNPHRREQVGRGPVTAADRAVAPEVLDRLRGEQVALVAVEQDEDRPEVAVQREAMAHREERVHVPAQAQDPRPFRDRLVHRRVAVDRHHLEVSFEIVARELRSCAVSERREQIDQLALAVEAHAAVAYDMRERGDALDVIADVGRCAGRTRMPVVHDREHRALARRGRGGRRVGVGCDP